MSPEVLQEDQITPDARAALRILYQTVNEQLSADDCTILDEIIFGGRRGAQNPVDCTSDDYFREAYRQQELGLREHILADYNLLGETMGDTVGLSEASQQLLLAERDFLWILLQETLTPRYIRFSFPNPFPGFAEPYHAMTLIEAARRAFLTGSCFDLYDGITNNGLSDGIANYDENKRGREVKAIREKLGLNSLSFFKWREVVDQNITKELAQMPADEWTQIANQVQCYIMDYLSNRAIRLREESDKHYKLVDALFTHTIPSDETERIDQEIRQGIADAASPFGHGVTILDLAAKLKTEGLTWCDLLTQLSSGEELDLELF